MQVNFVFPKQKPVSLGAVKPGSIIRLADSGKWSQDSIEAIINPSQNFFMVFKDDKPASGHVDLVSIDGESIIRKQGDRMVTVHGSFDSSYGGSPALGNTCLSSVPLGAMVVYGIGPGIFSSLKSKRIKKDCLHLVAKGNPTPAGKVVLVSSRGDKVYADDDLSVRVFENYTVELDP